MRGTQWLALGAIVLGLGAAFACSSSPPGPPYPDQASFCSALATAECQVTAVCATTTASCVSTETSLCNAQGSTYVAAGRAYQVNNAKACIDAANTTYGAVTNNPLLKAAALTALNTTCEQVFLGSVANNGSCTSDYDCSDTSAVCTFLPGATTGNCGVTASVTLGNPCNNPGDQCTGSYCGGASAPYSCIALLPNGAQCNTAAESNECVGHCVSPGICTALSEAGGSCLEDTDCDGNTAGFCDPYAGYKCDEGEIFSSTSTALCANFGFGATPGVAPLEDAGTPDSGSGSDSGSDAGTGSDASDASAD